MIERLLGDRAVRPEWVRLDAGHDCAVVEGDLAVTVDTLVEGVHFDARSGLEDIGFKAVAVSVSDLIATRAQPRWMLLALSLPRAWTAERRADWVTGFSAGLAAACRRFGVYLVGGDVTAVPTDGPVYVSTTLGGRCVGRPRARAGAAPGELLWVTGWPGLAGAGWMSADPDPAALDALRRPLPPVAFGLLLDHATAAMDLSDGLAADLPRLAAASGVGLELDAAEIPAHSAIASDPALLRYQVRGGEDFQLVFTAPPEATDAIRALGARTATPVHPIGRVVADSGAQALVRLPPAVQLIGAAWPPAAFSHFGGA